MTCLPWHPGITLLNQSRLWHLVSAGRPDTSYHVITNLPLTSVTVTAGNLCSDKIIMWNLCSFAPVSIKWTCAVTLKQSQLKFGNGRDSKEKLQSESWELLAFSVNIFIADYFYNNTPNLNCSHSPLKFQFFIFFFHIYNIKMYKHVLAEIKFKTSTQHN